jgi:hypothetical protein
MSKKQLHAPKPALIEVAQAMIRKLDGGAERLDCIAIRLKSGIRIRVDVLPEGHWQPAASPAARPAARNRFVPTPFQKGILQALDGQARRTDDLAHKVGSRRKLFIHPGGLRELQDQGLVGHHKRLGYYRPDAPPSELKETEEKPA